jgi:hypothetical protein
VRGVLVILILAAACGPVSRPFNDGTPPLEDASLPGDTPSPDDTSSPTDASSEGSSEEPPLPPTPGQEIVGGAGRLRSATFTLDVQVGHPVGHQPMTSSKYGLEVSTVMKP